MHIIPFSIVYLEDVKKISDEQLGKDYISIDDFKTYTLSHNSFINIALFGENNVVGFSICQIENKTDFIKNHMKEFTSFNLPHNSEEIQSIGIINTIATKESEKKKGIASALLTNCEVLLKKRKTQLVYIFAWKSKEGINIEKILKINNFKAIIEFKKYWYKESIINNFECADCGKPPCNCSAILFHKLIV